jgi:hypothetical protein
LLLTFGRCCFAVFHLLKAKLLDASGSTDDALKVLEQGFALPGVSATTLV